MTGTFVTQTVQVTIGTSHGSKARATVFQVHFHVAVTEDVVADLGVVRIARAGNLGDAVHTSQIVELHKELVLLGFTLLLDVLSDLRVNRPNHINLQDAVNRNQNALLEKRLRVLLEHVDEGTKNVQFDNEPDLRVIALLQIHLLHVPSIDRIANHKKRVVLQIAGVAVNLVHCKINEPHLHHHVNLLRRSRRHVANNPENLLLPRFRGSRVNLRNHVQQSGVQHSLRVVLVSRHDVAGNAQCRVLDRRLVAPDQHHQFVCVNVLDDSLLLLRIGIRKEGKRPADVWQDIHVVPFEQILKEEEMRLDVVKQPGNAVLIPAQIRETPNAVLEHAQFIGVSLHDRDDL